MAMLYLPPGLIDKARKKFGSHAKVAKAMGVPGRTFADWRLRGFRFAKAYAKATERLLDCINGNS